MRLEINIYTEINASSANNKIGLEMHIYTEINASRTNNQIGLSTSTLKSMNLVQAIKYN